MSYLLTLYIDGKKFYYATDGYYSMARDVEQVKKITIKENGNIDIIANDEQLIQYGNVPFKFEKQKEQMKAFDPHRF